MSDPNPPRTFLKKAKQKIRQKAREHLPYLFILALIFLMLFFYLFNSIVITISAGEAGVLWRRFQGGTVVDRVYGEGIKLIFPWDRMQIYNVRIQQKSHSFSVLTRNGLMIDLVISIRFHPEYPFLGLLHKRVGPDYLNAIVIPEIENVLRILLGRLDAEDVYRTEKALIARAINSAIDQLARKYVRVDDVIIKMVRLPEVVAKSIQEKMTQKHLADAYNFRLKREEKEARRKAIEAGGLKTYNETVAKSLSRDVLAWLGIRATLELARSDNAKVVVVGSGDNGLPLIGNIPMDTTGNAAREVLNLALPDTDTPQAPPPAPVPAPAPEAPVQKTLSGDKGT